MIKYKLRTFLRVLFLVASCIFVKGQKLDNIADKISSLADPDPILTGLLELNK